MGDYEDWMHWLNAIDLVGEKLTKWEEGFLDALKARHEEMGLRLVLSERQSEILHRIYKDKAS